MKKYFYLLLLFCQINLFGQQSESRPKAAQSDHVEGEILFQLNQSQSLATVKKDLQKQDFEFTGHESFKLVADNFRLYSFQFDPSVFDEKTVLKLFQNTPSVSAAQFNHFVEQRGNPNDPLFPQQWSLPKINAPMLWDKTTGGVTACGDTITVGILEFGFWDNAQDLQSNIWINKGEIPNNNIDDDGNGYVDDYRGIALLSGKDNHRLLRTQFPTIADKNLRHGTGVAGTIGAVGNNANTISGVNWKIKLMLISGATDDSKIIAGYDYLLYQHKLYQTTNGRRGAFVPITNLSAGYSGHTVAQHPLLCSVYDTLGKYGILNFVAVDNTFNDVEKNGDVPTLCAKNSQVAVTASNNLDDIDGHAFSLKFVHLAAPGKSVPVLTQNNETEIDSGTSFATPLAAGAAALLLSMPEKDFCLAAKANPVAAMARLKDAILRGVDKTPFLSTRTISGGRLNVWNAYNQLRRSFGQPLGAAFDILQITPNPVSQTLFLKIQTPEELSDATISIFNTIGQAVYERKLTSDILLQAKIEIKTAAFPPGLYFLTIRTTGFESVKRFVVTHP